MSDDTYTKSHAFPGVGLILKIGTVVGTLPEFTTVGETKSFAGPNLKNDTADVTNTQSPNGVKEFISTLTDPGEVSTTVNYVPGDAGQQAVKDALIAKAVTPFTLSLPPASIADPSNKTPGFWSFDGLVTEYNVDMPLDKESTVAIKIKVSGLPTYTPEAA